MSRAVSNPAGDRLFGLVEAYAELGDHRTGSDVDAATSDWFAAELEARGAVVETFPFDFDVYEAEASVAIDGQSVDSLPLFYEAVGSLETATPAVAELQFVGGFLPGEVDQVVASARADAPTSVGAVVLATRGHGNRLVALNRAPELRDGTPSVLVAGRELDALTDGSIRVRWEARIAPGSSTNVIGLVGGSAPDPYVIATPLSGWFACAGERGTGIALALEAAKELAATHPVLVVGTAGHELEYLGQRRLLPELSSRIDRPRAVVHLGAGVAVGELAEGGGFSAPALRLAMVAARGGASASLAEVLRPAGYEVGPGPAIWPGEGEAWRQHGAPTLSLISAVERIHTRDDLPEQTTSPAILADVHRAIVDAMQRLVR